MIRELRRIVWLAIVKFGNYNIEDIKKDPDPGSFGFLTISLTRVLHISFFPAEGFQQVFFWLRDPGTGFVDNPYNGRLRSILSLFLVPLYSCPNL